VEIVLLISYWMEVRLTRDFSSDLDYLFVRTITYDTVFDDHSHHGPTHCEDEMRDLLIMIIVSSLELNITSNL
jgi:hypothetical protein